jgi:hypothetical protein
MGRAGWFYWGTVGLAGVTIVLVFTYIILVQENRSVQAEVNRRQQFINQGIQLGRLNETLIRSIAAAAVNNKDERLRDLLTQSGITINVTTPTPSSGEPAEKEATTPSAVSPGTGR